MIAKKIEPLRTIVPPSTYNIEGITQEEAQIILHSWCFNLINNGVCDLDKDGGTGFALTAMKGLLTKLRRALQAAGADRDLPVKETE